MDAFWSQVSFDEPMFHKSPPLTNNSLKKLLSLSLV